MEKKYRYLGFFMLLLVPLTIAAFFKSYIEPFPVFEKRVNYLTHIHAGIATVWILILIAQPFLIYNKKYSIHKTIGQLSYVVFPLLMLSFIPEIIRQIKSANPENIFFPVGDGVLLIAFYSLAVYYRKHTKEHMRFMIATSIVFLGPTVGRIGPLLFNWTELTTMHVQYTIIYSILISLMVYDKFEKTKFYPYLIAASGFVLHQLVYYWIFL
jgi:hypothetical protein